MADVRLTGENFSGDNRARQEASLRYIVTDVAPAAIPRTPGSPPIVGTDGTILPVPGQVVNGQLVERIGVADLGNGQGSEVLVYFGDRFQNSGLVSPDKPEYSRVIPSFVDVQVPLPHQILTRETVTTPGGPTTIVAYEPLYLNVIETRSILRARVSVATLNGAGRATIRNQINKLHTIGGSVHRFTGAQTQPNQDRIDIYYEWEFDPGSPMSPISTADVYSPSDAADAARGGATIGTMIPVPEEGLCRSPYASLQLIMAEDIGDPHSYRQVFSYVPDPTGWQALPGIELLDL